MVTAAALSSFAVMIVDFWLLVTLRTELVDDFERDEDFDEQTLI